MPLYVAIGSLIGSSSNNPSCIAFLYIGVDSPVNLAEIRDELHSSFGATVLLLQVQCTLLFCSLFSLSLLSLWGGLPPLFLSPGSHLLFSVRPASLCPQDQCRCLFLCLSAFPVIEPTYLCACVYVGMRCYYINKSRTYLPVLTALTARWTPFFRLCLRSARLVTQACSRPPTSAAFFCTKYLT